MSGLRWSAEQYAAWQRREEAREYLETPPSAEREPGKGVVATAPEKRLSGPKFRSRAEARYAEILESQRRSGQIDAWRHEAVTLTLADGCRYTPDFLVIERGRMTLIEVKGFMREAARLRLRIAVEQYPHFGWYLIWAKRSGFEPERLA